MSGFYVIEELIAFMVIVELRLMVSSESIHISVTCIASWKNERWIPSFAISCER